MLSFVVPADDYNHCGFHFAPYPASVRYAKRRLLDKKPFLCTGPQGRSARWNFYRNLQRLMSRQHRTHCYAFVVAGNVVRAVRLDRVGCLISEPIDLDDGGDGWRVLESIVYRLAASTEWGFDETATLASRQDTEKVHAYKPANAYLQKYRTFMIDNQRQWPIYKVTCPVVTMDGSTTRSKTKSFLIGRPIFCNPELMGRCTRGYLAFDLAERRLVFLKDAWHNVSKVHPELHVYRRLHERGVPYIATPIAGGDIDRQRTLSQTFTSKTSEDAYYMEHVHLRMVFKEVGIPLESYRDSVELLRVMMHAFIGHWQAWDKAKIMHADVSLPNIMIDVETGEGFMNDWDLALSADDFPTWEPQQYDLGGTPVYRSALALGYPRKPREIADDIESFVQIAIALGMRYHWHDKSVSKHPTSEEERLAANAQNTRLAELEMTWFFHTWTTGEWTEGGSQKMEDLLSNELPVKFKEMDGQPIVLSRFLHEAFATLSKHYQKLDLDAYQHHFEAERPKPKRRPWDQDGTWMHRAVQKIARTEELMRKAEGAPAPMPRDEMRSPSPSPPPPPPPPPLPGPRENLNHATLYNIFASILLEKDGRYRDFGDMRDKTFDQLYDRTVPTYAGPTEPLCERPAWSPASASAAGGDPGASASGTASGKKRKRGAQDEEAQTSKAKKAKRPKTAPRQPPAAKPKAPPQKKRPSQSKTGDGTKAGRRTKSGAAIGTLRRSARLAAMADVS
ncbi:hypothetical protein PsYK624_099020 [Phanerochaete sordida]|uniref:Fungal-type protein kinase domain-containing protein n=1 Tax=Phanerochaete sordida TaxID=48140 RepID=A0A9P3GF23_9APHY|nr:hypothetical protein PsYK624_099020 [Phanerochaete sordida]